MSPSSKDSTFRNEKNWLSLRPNIWLKDYAGDKYGDPNEIFYGDDPDYVYFGEIQFYNKRHGRGITIYGGGYIEIDYYKHDKEYETRFRTLDTPGLYIEGKGEFYNLICFQNEDVSVGHVRLHYLKDGSTLKDGFDLL